MTDVTANDGAWTFLCASWTSDDGAWQIYKDGVVSDAGVGLAAGQTVSPGGTFVLGQEQDLPGGGFSAAESFSGQLFGLTLWSKSLQRLDNSSFR